MSMTLATTGNNALRSVTVGVGEEAVNGLGIVRYWTYTKYPLGESWEAYFPTTIYLVGCNPPFSVSLYCTGDSTKKVLYHSNDVCSTTNPGGDYVISYDRRAHCPTDLSEICDNIEEPGEVVPEKTTVPLCIESSGSWNDLIGLAYFDAEPHFYNCVEGFWKIAKIGGVIDCYYFAPSWNLEYGSSFIYGGDGEMSGDSTNGWTRGPGPSVYTGGIVTISPTGAVSYSYTYAANNLAVFYSGTGSDIELDPIYNCPIGSSTIPVHCNGWCNYASYWAPGQCYNSFYCLDNCGDHPIVTLAGSITITTSIKIGSC
jgi:hypothetical protein